MRRISMTIRPSFMSHSLGWLQLEHLFYTLLEVLLPYEPVCPALGRLLYHNFLGRPRQITLSVIVLLQNLSQLSIYTNCYFMK